MLGVSPHTLICVLLQNTTEGSKHFEFGRHIIRLSLLLPYYSLTPVQPSAPTHAIMEGPALLLTLAPVMRGGLECSVKQVGKTLMRYHQLPIYSSRQLPINYFIACCNSYLFLCLLSN